MKKFAAILFVLLLATTVMFGQLKTGSMGISTNFSSGANSIGVAYALQENMRINAALGFYTVSKSGGSGFNIGGGVQYYMGTVENVSMFVGGDLKFQSTTPAGANASSYTGIGLDAFAGAEYWFSPRFSWSGQVGFGFMSAGSPSVTTLETGASTGLTWYFK
jgi:hypothetical protein